MKTNQLFHAVCKTRYLALLVVLIFTCGNAWGTSKTWPQTMALPGDYTNIDGDANVQIKVSSTNSYTSPIRVYANTTISIRVASGYTIESVTYVASSTGNYVTYAQNATVSPSATPTVSSKNVTWSYSSTTTEFTFKPSSQTRSTGITVVYSSTGGGSTCATPTFSPAAGDFCGSTSVEISCATGGATIHYTTDGSTTPTESSPTYSAAIPLTSTTTIKAKAFKSEYTASAEASATYTNTALTSMDAIFSRATAVGSTETAVCITFNNWVVSGASSNGRNVYVTDGTKGFIIYGSGDTGFRQGDILSGSVSCVICLYYGAAELKSLTTSTTGLTITKGGSVSPITVDASDISALTGVHTGCVVTTTGVCGTCNTDKQCINGAQLFNQLYSYTTPTNSNTYTATGVYVYNTTYGREILPLSDLTTFTITAQSNNNSYGTVSVSNGVITATPASGYRVSTTTAYTISPAGSATVTDNGDNTFTVTPSANTTITINFELIPTYTVTWSVSGNTTSYPATTGVVGGTTTTAPTVSPSPCGTFMGWTTAANASYSDPSNPPSPLFTGTTPAITDNVTFYAVFADEN